MYSEIWGNLKGVLHRIVNIIDNMLYSQYIHSFLRVLFNKLRCCSSRIFWRIRNAICIIERIVL